MDLPQSEVVMYLEDNERYYNAYFFFPIKEDNIIIYEGHEYVVPFILHSRHCHCQSKR